MKIWPLTTAGKDSMGSASAFSEFARRRSFPEARERRSGRGEMPPGAISRMSCSPGSASGAMAIETRPGPWNGCWC